jgi:hypothetical protein
MTSQQLLNVLIQIAYKAGNKKKLSCSLLGYGKTSLSCFFQHGQPWPNFYIPIPYILNSSLIRPLNKAAVVNDQCISDYISSW